MKKDITTHSERELSLLVFKDESLYENRHSSFLIDMLDDNFIYTEEQRKNLEWDLEEDKEELETEDQPY